jgi:TonB family protein
VGIVQAGRIIEEKLIGRAEGVSIGTSARNTFTILASSLPRSYTLFEVAAGRTHLLFTDAIDGRISLGGRILTLAQAVKENRAQRRGVGWRLPLSHDARGKLVLGEVTVLFQFVVPPPPQPRARLPRSIRGGFFSDLDWTLANCILVVLCLEAGFIAYLRGTDWPGDVAIDRVPDRFARYIVLERPKPKPKDTSTARTDEAAAKVEEEKAEEQPQKAGPKKQADPEVVARAAAERRARLAEQVSRVGVLKILGSKGGSGAVADLIRGGDPGADADRAFANVGGVGMAAAGTNLQGRGAGGGTVVGIEGLRGVGGPGAVETGARSGEKEVKGVVRDEAPSVDGTIDAGVIAKEIRRRMGAVRACYERELKRNPQLGGKVVVRFVIGANGAVTEAEIESNTMQDDAVGECIVANIKRFRFPPPEGGSVEVSYPFVFQPSS